MAHAQFCRSRGFLRAAPPSMRGGSARLRKNVGSLSSLFLSTPPSPSRSFINVSYNTNHYGNAKRSQRNYSNTVATFKETSGESINYTRVDDKERYYNIFFGEKSGDEIHFQKNHPFYPRLKNFHMNEIVHHQPVFNYADIIKRFKEEERANQLNIHQYNCILPMLPARKQLFIFNKLIRNSLKKHGGSDIVPNLTTMHTIISRLVYEGKHDMAKEFMLRNLEHVGKFFALTFFINFPL